MDVITELERILKIYWQVEDFCFIGKYKIHESKKIAWFTELRNIQGDLLYFPENKTIGIRYGIASATVFPRENLTEGEYYQFNAQINTNEREALKNPLFVTPQAFGEISFKILKKIEHENFIKNLFKRNGSTPRDAKNLANSLRNFQIELYTKTERFIFELLQNADDFPSDGKSVNVKFESLSENILITHNGRPFSERDVESICSIGDSAKSKDVSATGYKGIGFKSVFTHSRSVFINSGSFSFCFDSDFGSYKKFESLYRDSVSDNYYKDKYDDYIGINNVPWQIKPIWREFYRYPDEVQKRTDFFSSNVGFCLEFGKQNVEEFDNKIIKLFSEPRFLLFLRNISGIEIQTKRGEVVIKRKFEANKVILLDNQKEQQYLTFQSSMIDISHKKEEFKLIQNIPPKLTELPYITISFAALLNNDAIIPNPDSVIFTYLPTEDRNYNFPFLVNCDFVTSSNREQILPDNKWNQFVFENVGYQLFLWIADLAIKQEKYLKSIYNLIPPLFEKDSEIYEFFDDGYKKAINEIRFIPDYTNELRKLDEILIDETGLLALLGIEEFKNSTDILQFPIYPDLIENQVIKNLIEDFDLGKVYKKDDLISWTENQDDEWFKDPQNNAEFLKLISNKKWWADFKSFTIFLDQNGDLCSSEAIYTSFGDDLDLLSWLPLSYLSPKVTDLIGDIYLPIQKYSPKDLVLSYILPNKSTVDGYLDVEENNLRFYRFLFKYKSEFIPDTEFFNAKALGYFKVWGSNDQCIIDFGKNIYLFDETLQSFLDESVFPDEQFYLLSNKFCESDSDSKDWENFWRKFGVQEYNSNGFIQKEIIAHVKKLENHFDDYDSWEIDESPSETYLQKKKANSNLWYYLSESWENFLTKDLDNIQKSLSELVVFTNEHCTTRPLKECWLSSDYTDDDTIENLSKQFPDIEVHFISSDYLKSNELTKRQWKKLFLDCGSQNNPKQFANRVLFELSNIQDENLIGVTKFLFDQRNELQEEIQSFENFKVELEDGSIVEPKQAILGYYYTENELLNTILPSIELPNSISSKYTNKYKEKWVDFFEKLGVVYLNTEEDIIDYKIKYLLKEQDTVHTVENTISIIHQLAELDIAEKLKLHYNSLGELDLLLKYTEGTYMPAKECHLSSEYHPKLDLDTLLGDVKPKIFVSEKYESKTLKISSFFRKIGVKSDFEVVEIANTNRSQLDTNYRTAIDRKHPYISDNAIKFGGQHIIKPWITLKYQEFLTNPKVSPLFWSKIKDNNSFREKIFSQISYSCAFNSFKYISFPYFSIIENAFIPTRSNLTKKPYEVYSYNFYNVIENDDLLPSIDLSNVLIDQISLEQLIGVKQKLSLELCLMRIIKISDFIKLQDEGIWRRLKEIFTVDLKDISQNDKTALANFKENGSLPNQLGEWKPINELYYISDGFELGVGNSQWLIIDDLKNLSSHFGITSLIESDFKPEFKNKSSDVVFESKITERLKYISFAENQSDWVNLQNVFKSTLKEFNFYQVNRISFSYSDVQPPIENTEKNFYQDDKNIYYVGGWDRPRAVEVFSFIFELLALEKVSIKLLQDLLLISEHEIIDYFLEKNLDVPTNWLKHTKPISYDTTTSEVRVFNEPPPPTNITGSDKRNISEESEIDELVIISGLSKEEREKVNREAKEIALAWLREQNFNCREVIKDYDKILNAKGADGIIYTVIVNSISGGKLYVRPINWLELDEANTFLLTVDKGKVTKINSTKELLSRYAKTIMRVDNNQDVREEISIIAQITSHVATTQFVFFDIESKFDEIVKVYSNSDNVENKEIVFNTELNDDLDD